MIDRVHAFEPDYAIPPGAILEEALEARSLSKSEFARRCGRPTKTVSEIIAGKAGITPETAIQFERVLGVPASFWTNLEYRYQLRMAEAAELEDLATCGAWADRFPVNELVKFDLIPEPSNTAETVQKLLDFFGVASVHAWERRFDPSAVAYRRSKAFESAPEAVACWLQWGEVIARDIACEPFDGQEFRRALQEIRELTREERLDAWPPRLLELCRSAGDAVAFAPELPKTRLSGAARWLTKDKALIQLSLRHKTDDHLWFTFFHEAGHILLHGKKDVFIDDETGRQDEKEEEADRFATNALIPLAAWRAFAARPRFSKLSVSRFAEQQGIAAGIVVGRLQHEELLPYTHLNGLKRRFEWTVRA